MGRRSLLVAGVLAMLATGIAGGRLVWLASSERSLGADLFFGRAMLQGKLSGHDDPLPAAALRCANCHTRDTVVRPVSQPAAGPMVPVAADVPASASFAPELNAASLVAPRARRGGPPSAFDERSFCRLLREGIDPTWIVLPRAMPRYELTDAQCKALWVYASAA